jgi:hypothetical protein
MTLAARSDYASREEGEGDARGSAQFDIVVFRVGEDY